MQPTTPALATRFVVTVFASATAALAMWGAWALPWRPPTVLSFVLLGVAAVHVATGLTAFVRPRAFLRMWRAQALVSLTFVVYLTWHLVRSATAIATLYGGLGQGIALTLGLIWLIVVAVFVPTSAWALAVSGVGWSRGKTAGMSALLVLAAANVQCTRAQVQGQTVAGAHAQALPAVQPQTFKPPIGDVRSLYTLQSATCTHNLGTHATALVTFLHAGPVVGRAEAISRCVQSESGALNDAIAAMLREHAVRGPVKLDIVTHVAAMPMLPAMVQSLLVRPGLDGVCDEQICLAPWQLVAADVFSATRPIPVIPELRFGVDVQRLRTLLHTNPTDAPTGPLQRIATRSVLVDEAGHAHALRRLRTTGPALTRASLQHATEQAAAYIARMQGEDGRFVYRLEPFLGSAHMNGFSLARQAGTTAALCESGALAGRADVAERAASSLAMLSSTMVELGEHAALHYPPPSPTRKVNTLTLGDAALPVIAFLRCRPHVGARFDATWAPLVRFLLAMQRDDGSFAMQWNATTNAPNEGPDMLYAAGQATLALVLAEQAVQHEPNIELAGESLHYAVQRAMTYYARTYWQGFHRAYFFVEENWHCLAARAALASHRHPDYEQFCLDYVAFKSRLILDEESAVDTDFLGGYGFGNVFVPHNTGTSGFGEAVAAALALRAARNEDDTHERATMRLVLQFLLHHQTRAPSCFACQTSDAEGGFSEHMASPHIRIDYVQHALSAMSNGGQALGLLSNVGASA